MDQSKEHFSTIRKIVRISTITGLFVILLLIIFHHDRTVRIDGTKPTIIHLGTVLESPYCWATSNDLVVFRIVSGKWNCFLYNISDGSNVAISHVNRFLAAFPDVNWNFHVHAPWILADSISETNMLSYLSKLDGSVAYTNELPYSFRGRLFWMPTELAWLRCSVLGSRIDRGSIFEQTTVGRGFVPAFPVGFVSNYLFLSSPNDLVAHSDPYESPYPKKLQLEYWHLGAVPVLKTTKSISIDGKNIVSAKVSPEGDRIVWTCLDREFPQIQFSWKRPFINKIPRYTVKFYVSSSMVNDLQLVGSFVPIGDTPQVQWRPDGGSISFDYKGALYILPVRPPTPASD